MSGISILDFSRDQVKAMGQSGLMNIKSAEHWDVCNELKKGKTYEQVAEDMGIHKRTVEEIKRKKCPCP